MFDPVLQNLVKCASKVTARGGRPVLICEEGDVETQRLNPDNCLTIPHTVDCLQVVIHIASSLKLNTTHRGLVLIYILLQGILSVIPLQLLSYHMAVLK